MEGDIRKIQAAKESSNVRLKKIEANQGTVFNLNIQEGIIQLSARKGRKSTLKLIKLKLLR
jgi:hypothetical protein